MEGDGVMGRNCLGVKLPCSWAVIKSCIHNFRPSAPGYMVSLAQTPEEESGTGPSRLLVLPVPVVWRKKQEQCGSLVDSGPVKTARWYLSQGSLFRMRECVRTVVLRYP
jgi:hypothetical protein